MKLPSIAQILNVRKHVTLVKNLSDIIKSLSFALISKRKIELGS